MIVYLLAENDRVLGAMEVDHKFSQFGGRRVIFFPKRAIANPYEVYWEEIDDHSKFFSRMSQGAQDVLNLNDRFSYPGALIGESWRKSEYLSIEVHPTDPMVEPAGYTLELHFGAVTIFRDARPVYLAKFYSSGKPRNSQPGKSIKIHRGNKGPCHLRLVHSQ